MSKLSNRNAIKSLSNLNVDAQYVYTLGLQVFNDNGQNPEAHKELSIKLQEICQDLSHELETIKQQLEVNTSEIKNITPSE